VVNPPGIYGEVYSIGALNNGTDTIASFSSRGPVTADGSNRLKPDLCAPGTNVRSSYNSSDTSYANLSGTSMATPHVAGAVALLWSAHPELKNDIADTITVLNNSAQHILSNACDSGPPATPNNTYGNGRVNILAAVQQARPLAVTSASSVKTHGGSQSFGIPLPLSGAPGVECRTGGASGNFTIVVTFSNNVVSGSATVTSGTGTVSGSPSFSGNTMTVNLTGVTDQQTITLSASNVTDVYSNVLTTTSVQAGILLGDVNGDAIVNGGDTIVDRSHAGQTLDGTNFRNDVNLDGFINGGDTTIVRAHSGDSL
jgi:hypothetical protein